MGVPRYVSCVAPDARLTAENKEHSCESDCYSNSTCEAFGFLERC